MGARRKLARRARNFGLALPALPSIPVWGWIAGGVGLLAGAGLWSKRDEVIQVATGAISSAVAAGYEGIFAASLPGGLQPYAASFITAGRKWGVSPWMLAGICWQESLGGAALRPWNETSGKNGGPHGTGDFAARPTSSPYFKYANPATGLPPDGNGWGRGLMQMDFGAENAWVTSHSWWEPSVIIDYAAEKMSKALAYFAAAPGGTVNVAAWRFDKGLPYAGVKPWRDFDYAPRVALSGSSYPYPDPRPLSGSTLFEAALASYNAGLSGVLQACAAGVPPTLATARNDYVTRIATFIGGWIL